MGWGACKLHGGCVRSHGKAAAFAQVKQVAALFGVPRDDIDQITGLTEELQRSAGLIDSYEAMCAQLGADEVVYGELGREETRPAVHDDGENLEPSEVKVKHGAAINVWVRLLNNERDRFIRLCESMVKLDLENRRIALGQAHVAVLVSILMSSDLALSPDQLRVAARMMREADARQAIEGSVV